jgi:hypothetical protein
MKNKIAILVVTYTKFDFLVQPLIQLINLFWLNHPPIFVVGTGKRFVNAETINLKEQDLTGWVSNYYAGLKFLHQEGFTSFYLILDDLHPIGHCDADYLNNYLPETAANYQAGYVYSMAHFNLLKTCGESENGWLHLTPQSPYSISLQVGYWNLDYALLVTERIQKEGIKDIWNYEVQGSLLDFSDHRPNFILKQGVKCLLADSTWQNLPEAVNWHISRTPYPFVRGGFLYQGRSTPVTRKIYREFLGSIPEIQDMINTTTTFNYRFLDFRRRIKRKFQTWKILTKN